MQLLDSTYGSDFAAPGADAYMPGRRIMRTQDGEEAVRQDMQFLRETGIVAPTTDRFTETEGVLPEDSAISVWRERPGDFASTKYDDTFNPHNRNSQFSMPIDHYTQKAVKDI